MENTTSSITGSSNDEQESTDQKLRQVRLEIDSLINTAKLLAPSREVSLAYTNLQRGKMWLGKALGAFGSPSPYVNSTDPSNKIIDAQAEHTEHAHVFPADYGHVEQIKQMRHTLASPISKTEEILVSVTPSGLLQNYVTQSFLALEEAKMWYGCELDRIRQS